jgi:hypothetical protein
MVPRFATSALHGARVLQGLEARNAHSCPQQHRSQHSRLRKGLSVFCVVAVAQK